MVAYDGAPQTPVLGPLGVGTRDQAAAKLNQQAEAYDTRTRPVLPAMELIATIAQRDAGLDGNYNARQEDDVIADYLAAARRAKMLLILDIQPGQSSFMTEVHHFGKWLRQPDVGIALDPEWSMQPGEVPGTVIGSTNATIVNQVADYMAGYVRKYKLPQKLLMVHQFTSDMIKNRGQIQTVPGDRHRGHRRRLGRSRRQALEVPPVRPHQARPVQRSQALLHAGHQPDEAPRGDASASLARRDRLPVAQPGTAPSPANASRASSSVVPGCGST